MEESKREGGREREGERDVEREGREVNRGQKATKSQKKIKESNGRRLRVKELSNTVRGQSA